MKEKQRYLGNAACANLLNSRALTTSNLVRLLSQQDVCVVIFNHLDAGAHMLCQSVDASFLI